eukprot:Transcript_17254.p1 GENE.Transcript_17254~~Transcript_17254.p1  ORF type:complete len:374 (-),score=131.42 Transcript_17254:233-1354(-)
MATPPTDDDEWCNVDMSECGEGPPTTDGAGEALQALAVDPDHLDWPYSREGGFGEPVDAAAASRGAGEHASLRAVLRQPRLLTELLTQADWLVTAGSVRPVWRPCALAQVVPRFLEQLVVYDVGLPLVRVGSTPGRAGFEPPRFPLHGDGGYVMCDPSGTEVCYSYGISQEVTFDAELVRAYGVRRVRQFDMTLDGYVPALAQFDFVPEGVGPARDAAARVDTLEAHVKGRGELSVRKVLQMDVEGAEWESLWACPGEVLASFDHIVLELHGVSELLPMRRRAATLAKLNLYFFVVHVHVNNHGLDRRAGLARKFERVLGYDVPTTLEVSLVSRRLVPDLSRVVRASRRLPIDGLDHPNVRAPDVLLNVWPWA